MRSVKFVQTHDGKSLAWARSGSGPSLVKAAAWLTHLEYDAESPIWSHWLSFFEENFDYLRYDERGCGLSDRDAGQLDIDTWTDDLVRVIEASGMDEPLSLVAMSQGAGAAVQFAARHPDRVSRMVLIGGYARGAYHWGDPKAAELYRAIIETFRLGFYQDNPAFREVFTKRFLPGGDPEKMQWINELCHRATDAQTGSALMEARGHMNASDCLGDVRCPTLIFHARGDQAVPLHEGRYLAQHIPNAELRILDSENHILQEDEPAAVEAKDAILSFLGAQRPGADAGLTPRESLILSEICAAKSNKDIARTLDVSEKTVRNHATRIFAKLGVSTRQEAILKMQRQSS